MVGGCRGVNVAWLATLSLDSAPAATWSHEMRVLVVYAHPLQSSFVSAIHDRILRKLIAQGHQVDDLDLYAEGFQPVLTAREREVHYQAGSNLTGVEFYVERLRSAE